MAKRASKSVVSVVTTERFDFLGPPLLLVGEDPDKYNELLAQVYAAVTPLMLLSRCSWLMSYSQPGSFCDGGV